MEKTPHNNPPSKKKKKQKTIPNNPTNKKKSHKKNTLPINQPTNLPTYQIPATPNTFIHFHSTEKTNLKAQKSILRLGILYVSI